MKKILFVQWDAFMQKGMENALRRIRTKRDIDYDTFFYRLSDWEKDELLERILNEKLLGNDAYYAVLSVNFCPLISNACQRNNVAYIAWVYDCPLHIRNKQSLYNKCNRIYFFDRCQAAQYQEQGVTGAKHLPLAADTDMYDKIILDEADHREYDCDVSFVGSLYKSDYEYLCAPLTQHQRGYLEGIISAQSVIYGGYILGELLDNRLLAELNAQYNKSMTKGRGTVSGSPVSKEELEFALNCEITGRERYMALALLSGRHKVNIYSGDVDNRLSDAHFGGYLDYYSQMPKAFKASRINLNISLKAIQTGIPLRVLDVLGCGGFLITNYQEEIAENFVDGEELVMYSDTADMVARVDYYLKHDDERRAIAHNGYEKVKKEFSFDRRIEKLIF